MSWDAVQRCSYCFATACQIGLMRDKLEWLYSAGTGLAVTLNYHFGPSQCLCERDHIFIATTKQARDQRSTHVTPKLQKDVNKQPTFSLFPLFSSLTGSRLLEYNGSTWHEDCFACHGCEKPIGAEAFIPDKDSYYCVPCYEGRVAPQCSHCKKVGRASMRLMLTLLMFLAK